ncbi:hypothetical protein UCDDA912_g10601 [Diaporthe ampelina]|uniref:Uncharacterized protein n=1 Tax=Diaporthe ampelina TaxID=1214573 RepID=A0A0G2H2E2_9PEZI|nr:hypothetical protein UCDDA912_g10601 [Diaporthe ampelina]
MSVSAAASLLKFSDWSQYPSAQLAKKLEGLGVAPRPGKPRRQAQLNLWEMGRAWIPSSPDPPLTTAAAAEDRLVQLYGLRASEARDLATKYGITSAAEAGHTRLFELIKLIFVYEFIVARPANLAKMQAPSIKAGPCSTSSAVAAAAAANATAE